MPGLCLVNDLLQKALLERKTIGKGEGGQTFMFSAASVNRKKCLEGLRFLEGCLTDCLCALSHELGLLIEHRFNEE